MANVAGKYNTYIGMRYVPIFAGTWDATADYEPLTIVSYQGNSYTSRTFVPAGTSLDNEKYWALTGNYNAQIEQYRQQVQKVQEDVDNAIAYIESAYYTPELYGAVGDGVADDTKAFHDMIANAMSNNIPIMIPETTYKIMQPFYIPEHLCLSNAGRYSNKSVIVAGKTEVFNEKQALNCISLRGLGLDTVNVQGGCYNATSDRAVLMVHSGNTVYAAQFDANMQTFYSKTQIATDGDTFHAGDLCFAPDLEKYFVVSGNSNIRVFDSSFNYVTTLTIPGESVYGIDYDLTNGCLITYLITTATSQSKIALMSTAGDILQAFNITFNRPNAETYTSYQSMAFDNGNIFFAASVFVDGYNYSNFAIYKLNTRTMTMEPEFITQLPNSAVECENAFFTPRGLIINGYSNNQKLYTVRLSNYYGEYIHTPAHIIYVNETAASSGDGSSAANAINDLDFAFLLASQTERDIRTVQITATNRNTAFTVQRFRGNIVVDCDAGFPFIFRHCNVKLVYNSHKVTVPNGIKFDATASIVDLQQATVILNNTEGIGVGDGSFWKLRGLTVSNASSQDNILARVYQEGTLQCEGCTSTAIDYIAKTHYGGVIFNTYNNSALVKPFEHRTAAATSEGVIIPAP